MKMYIANCSQQEHDFVYRVPGQTSPRRQTIGVGEQTLISGDLSPVDIDYIVSQHAPYGMVQVDEIDRTRPFVGLCYDVDKSVPSKRMVFAVEHNESVLVRRGQVMREESAVALNNYVENAHQQSRLPGNLREVEVSAIEQQTARNPNPTFAEGVRVNRNAEPPSRGRRSRRAA